MELQHDLPERLFVRMEKDKNEPAYPLAYESSVDATTDDEEPTVVGEYKLVGRQILRRRTVTEVIE